MKRGKFAKERLGITLWPKLEHIYDLIDLGISRILVRSCNGAGKSVMLASLAVMEVELHDDLAIVMTGATSTQLYNSTWRHVKRLAKRWNLEKSKNLNKGLWEPKPGQVVTAISPASVESAQGYHAQRVIVIIDEATSMSSEKVTALLSNATGANSLCIFTYNPINADAVVYELEQGATRYEELLTEDGELDRERIKTLAASSEWLSIGISAFEHPNVKEGYEVIPGAITRNYVEDMLRIDSIPCDRLYPEAIILPWTDKAWMPTPEALARVCGQWSQTQTVGFISGSTVVNSWKVEPITGLRVAGADIGSGGEDPSVWTSFRGNEQMDFHQIKTGELGIVASMLHNYCLEHEIDILGIDDGGVGHGVTDRLRDFKPKYKLLPIDFGQSPKNFEETRERQPANARCEMYLLLEKEMRNQFIRIKYDKELQRELCSMKCDTHKQSGKLRLEDKKLIAKRIGRSPNKADATAIARYASRLIVYYNQPQLY